MWKDFNEAFGHKFHGVQGFQGVQIWVEELKTWVEWHDKRAQHRVQWMAFAAGCAGVALGLFIGWILWFA